jgi:hypothetical protein
MTHEEFKQIEQYEWDKFSRRYPYITDQDFLSRLMLVFKYKGNTQRLLWENGFAQGWIMGVKRYQKEQEP